MPLVGTTEMFKKAYEGHYAIGAFNVNNMEIIQGIMEAAKEENSPVILQASEGARNYAGQEYIVGLVKIALQDYPEIPTALHLDHGSSYEICKACIDGGFSSVMYDGSKHPYEENVRITKQIVGYAHDKGVVVEAELGRLAGAIAIGTSHGAYKYKGDPYLDYDRLEKVGKLLPDYPIVLHGASTVIPEFVEQCNAYGGKVLGAKGVPEDMLRKAATMAVCKINIDTDIRLAMTSAIRKALAEDPSNFDPRGYLKPAREAVKQMVMHKIEAVLGSANTI